MMYIILLFTFFKHVLEQLDYMLSSATTNSVHVLRQEQLGTGLILPPLQNNYLVPSHFTK